MSTGDERVGITNFAIVRAHVTFNAPRAGKTAVSALHTTGQANHTAEIHDH